MIKALIAGGAVVMATPMMFMVLLGGPQAATEAVGVANACHLMLGMAPEQTTTVEELGGPAAAAVAAALTRPHVDPDDPDVTVAPVADPETVAAVLQGERAYAFVTTLNTLDNWRELPIDPLARWAADPMSEPLPPGAQPLPELPAEQIDAVTVSYQEQTIYGRSCAAVISRATRLDVDPSETHSITRSVVDVARLLDWTGRTTSNQELLGHIDPDADQTDPRQFYLNYRTVARARAGDIVVYDFTTAGPAHFGIAVDDQQMITTGHFTEGTADLWPIPTNSAAMAATSEHDDPREENP